MNKPKNSSKKFTILISTIILTLQIMLQTFNISDYYSSVEEPV